MIKLVTRENINNQPQNKQEYDNKSTIKKKLLFLSMTRIAIWKNFRLIFKALQKGN
jgi:hypothetical protein